MQSLIEVVLPVFLLLGFGWLARWRDLFSDDAVEALMRFAQGVALPVLLFRAIAAMDLAKNFAPALLIAYYSGAIVVFTLGIAGARVLFARPWEDAIAIGLCAMFSNTLLMGVPITERAFGATALQGNFVIISMHTPFCYAISITAIEWVRGKGSSIAATLLNVLKGMARNPLVIGLFFGFVVNFAAIPIPAPVDAALAMLAGAALPVALFALGGILHRYRPEGDLRTILFICGLSLILHPILTFGLGRGLGLDLAGMRSAVLTAAMPTGVNAYLFASIYGVAKRVSASAVLIGTLLSIVTIWAWLSVLP